MVRTRGLSADELEAVSDLEGRIRAALKAGARGYIVKDMPFPVLVDSIVAVADGGAAISPQMAGKLFDVCRQLLRHQELLQRSRHTAFQKNRLITTPGLL